MKVSELKHKNWIKKAANDLRSSKVLVNEDILDTAVYHTQQSAEKALKGYLVYNQQNILKTHDLVVLLEYCIKIDDSFSFLLEEVESLNPYATEFRYPDDLLEPEKDDVLIAIKQAKKILDFVKNKVFELETGQENIF